jgi:hypothetical protein
MLTAYRYVSDCILGAMNHVNRQLQLSPVLLNVSNALQVGSKCTAVLGPAPSVQHNSNDQEGVAVSN